MKPEPSTAVPEKGITRRELEAVIRRAAELYAADADADERISEAELFRIAAELGLPAGHVRQALFELPTRTEASLLDHICGSALVGADRTVPGEADRTAARLDEYLITHQYLQLQRRQPGRASYAPAEDPISKLARAFSRPKARSHTARARRTLVVAQSLEPGWTRVRLELDLGKQRKKVVTDGILSGGVLGALAGAGLAIAAGFAAADLGGQVAGIATGALTFGGTTMTGVTAGLELARRGFRRRLAAARLELDGLLDRLERGERLEPPPAPWRRRLEARLSPRPQSR